MIKKKHFIFAAGLCILLTAAGLIGSWAFRQYQNRDDGIKYLIGVVQPNSMDSWILTMNEEMKAEAANHADIKILFFDSAQDNEKQKQGMDEMVSQGVDILIVTPYDSTYLSDAISRIYNNGTPVIVMGHAVRTDDYSMLIYCDNKKIGRLAGEYIAGLLGESGGTILEVQGEPGSEISAERKAGFREEVAAYPNIRIGYTIIGYWQRDKTEVRANEIFEKKSAVDVAFAYNDEMAIGVHRAAAGNDADIRIIGVDGMPSQFNGLDAIKNGLLDATFFYPTGGREAIINAMKILTGEEVPKQIELQTVLITKENLDEFLE
ncbi:MAG: substrate-binding domain-containing protein [Saccharofermentanales bacterium]